jgi:hypothetical protein
MCLNESQEAQKLIVIRRRIHRTQGKRMAWTRVNSRRSLPWLRGGTNVVDTIEGGDEPNK